MASLGYDAEWEVISARDVGAPHLRERLWIYCSLADPHRMRES
jgi:site-specific DNA-cytosine methylase